MGLAKELLFNLLAFVAVWGVVALLVQLMGVELRSSWWERIGVAIVFAAFIVVDALRRRKR